MLVGQRLKITVRSRHTARADVPRHISALQSGIMKIAMTFFTLTAHETRYEADARFQSAE